MTGQRLPQTWSATRESLLLACLTRKMCQTIPFLIRNQSTWARSQYRHSSPLEKTNKTSVSTIIAISQVFSVNRISTSLKMGASLDDTTPQSILQILMQIIYSACRLTNLLHLDQLTILWTTPTQLLLFLQSRSLWGRVSTVIPSGRGILLIVLKAKKTKLQTSTEQPLPQSSLED